MLIKKLRCGKMNSNRKFKSFISRNNRMHLNGLRIIIKMSLRNTKFSHLWNRDREKLINKNKKILRFIRLNCREN
jgi:hypothetical protein